MNPFKNFLIIAMLVGGIILLAAGFMDFGHVYSNAWPELFFGGLLLTLGLAWLWKRWPEVKARLNPPPTQ